jgi:hypothetical protein
VTVHKPSPGRPRYNTLNKATSDDLSKIGRRRTDFLQLRVARAICQKKTRFPQCKGWHKPFHDVEAMQRRGIQCGGIVPGVGKWGEKRLENEWFDRWIQQRPCTPPNQGPQLGSFVIDHVTMAVFTRTQHPELLGARYSNTHQRKFCEWGGGGKVKLWHGAVHKVADRSPASRVK